MIHPTTIVSIEPVDRDIRIGSVFNHIFSIIFQTEQTDSEQTKEIIWDFSKCSFLHPFYIGALAILKHQYGSRINISGIPSTLSRYLELIYFFSPLEINKSQNNHSIWDEYKGRTYLPICLFHPGDNSSIIAQELVQKAIEQQMGHSGPINGIISLLFSELIDNITEHSKSNEGFLFCQYLPHEKNLYIMILDSGRSIYSSYASDERYIDFLTDKESSGILMALRGKSTKDRPENENRGYGISKSRKLVVDGLGGEFFLLSGSAFARHDSRGETVIDLPGDLRWNGTAVLIKIPTSVPNNFNLYKYIS